MAEIFLAQDQEGKICAVKRILPHLAHQESFIRMFIDEARIVSQLVHPNIAAVYGQGKHEGYYYIAMEYVEGHSLLAFTERAKSTKMQLPHGLLAYVVSELLAGLGFAHSARDKRGRALGIVHRDVTPQNVLISYEGEVKLIDFGVAKARARLTQTEAGFTKGKLSYMSPEQARGESLDGRSDLFSVGIILHELTTNSRLFQKEGPGGILGAIVNEPIPRPSQRVQDYPPELEQTVMRALTKQVARRWQTAEEMQDALLLFAQRERPAPGPARLKELLFDLFGPPKSAGLLDKLRADRGPRPAGSRLGKAVPATVEGGQETRVFDPERDEAPEPSRVEVTADGIPAVAVEAAPPEPSPEEVLVPEVVAPRRVQIGRFLHALARDLRLSWRSERRRWLLGGGGLLLAALLGLGWYAGLFSRAAGWARQAGEAARELKGEGAPVPAPRAPPVLRVSSDPLGASISIDGIGMGAVTPAELKELPLGRPLQLELSLAGYRPLKASVQLDRGDKELGLKLQPMQGGLRVQSEPPGARARVGRRHCKTPCELRGLPPGPAKLSLSLRGYQPLEQSVQIEDGATAAVELSLLADLKQAASGSVSVKSQPSACPVWLDGRAVGRTPVEKLRARPGLHTVKLACESYEAAERSVEVFSGQDTPLSFSPRANAFGYLSVSVRPATGNTVIVGGRVRHDLSNIRLVAGRHQLVVKNDLYGERRFWVNIPKGRSVSQPVDFTR